MVALKISLAISKHLTFLNHQWLPSNIQQAPLLNWMSLLKREPVEKEAKCINCIHVTGLLAT